MKKFTFLFFLMIFSVLSANCLADAGVTVFSNGGLDLSIPEELVDRLVIETPENSERGFLFTVSEKASIEAAKENGETWEGAGRLFSIGRVDEERYHDMLCGDMSGVEVFAKDNEGFWYMYYHPTDVRLVRKDYSFIEKDMMEWGELCSWADSMKAKVIEDNGLTPETHSNSMLDIYLARMLYRGYEKYTVSTTEYGPVGPNGIKAADYIEPLVNGVKYEAIYDGEAPDGEYVVLNFPEDDIRFDFFLAEGNENIIRQVWYNGELEMLYKAVFEDESLEAAEIMHDFYLDLVLADSLGYTADDFIGIWAEKIAGRGVIEIRKGDAEGAYNITIHWGSSAFESYNWTMTAAAEEGPVLRYNDCKLIDLLFTSENESTETVVYENGKGTFSLLSTYELVWNDETGHAADDTVFVNAGS